MKRFTAFVISILFVLAFFIGCGNSSDSTGIANAVPGVQDTSDPANVDSSKEYILVGRVAPLTGAIANFGAGTPFIEEATVEKLNAEGGIYIEEYGKKTQN